VRRRLLLSYLGLTVVVLVLLEVPLGELYAHHERDDLTAAARQEAATLAVLAADSLESPGEHDLAGLASRYRQQTGAEVVITDAAGRSITTIGEEGGTEGDVRADLAAALAGLPRTSHRSDEDGPELAAAVPVRRGSRIVGAAVVVRSARPVDARVRRAWLALAAFAVGLVGIATGIGLLLSRSLAEPLAALQRAAGRFAGGDFDARAPESGPPEMATLAAEFNRMAGELTGLVAAERRFLADASHQLRTPLTALRLRLDNLGGDGRAGDADVEAAASEVQRLTRIVDGLLALSRAQQQPLPAEPVDVLPLLAERCDAWAALAEEQGVTVELARSDGARAGARAVVAPGHLEQIVDNLLANALEVTPAGGTITVTVDGDGGAGPGRLAVHVRDTGPGLTPDERRRAFDRFWQGGVKTGTSGLGLAIVRELALANDGSVRLDRADGGGVEAVVVLRRA
jgi:signal transduction histidine kinase